jgi:hypothetical protein
VSTYIVPCDSCGIRMMVTERRQLLCDECAGEQAQSDLDHIPPWQVHG